MKRLWELYKKYKEIINYLVVGGMTTLVTIVSYFVISKLVDIDNNWWFMFANVLSWVIAVAFAYVTNKLFVFESKTKGKVEMGKEMVKFFGSRVTTLVIELILMYVLVKVILIGNDIAKVIAQVVVIILNYVLSKIFVFKKKGGCREIK